MAVSYKKLFHMMIEKDMSNAELMQKAGFSANIITRMKRGGYISLESIESICRVMDCGVDEILDAAALFLSESDHLLQLSEPLGGIDKHGALAGHDHAGVAAAHTGEGIDVRGDLLDFNIGGADGVIVICPMALANSNNC